MKKRLKKWIAAVICVALLAPTTVMNCNIHITYAAEKLADNAIYVAPDANGKGSESDPMPLEKAITSVAPGQTVYLRKGTYNLKDTITIAEANSGSEGQYKTLRNYPGEQVVLDFSGQSFGKRGIVLEGSYWHIYGINICHAGDNGMLLAGDYNIIELCVFDGNRDTGLQLSRNNGSYNKVEQWPSYNYILNCTSRNNSDPDGEDADGFAPKLTCGEGNVFDGCLAYNNVDDGWDCYAKSATGPIGVVTIINCIAFRNGQTEDGVFTPDSDGNGFKLGGGGIGTPHVVMNCLAFENKNCGFTDNNNPSAISLINCTAFNNNLSGAKADFNVYRCKNANAVNLLAYNAKKNKNKFQNMSANYILYPAGNEWYQVTSYGAFDTTDSAKKGTKINGGLTEADFIQTKAPELGTDFHVLWRGADGSVQTMGYAMLDERSEYASFASDGGVCGARFGIGAEFVTPENVQERKAAALAGTAPVITEAPEPTATPQPLPTATGTPVPTAEPTATGTPVPTVEPTATGTPVPTAEPTATGTPAPTAEPTTAPTQDSSATGLTQQDVQILTLCAVLSVTIIALAVVIIILIFKKAK